MEERKAPGLRELEPEASRVALPKCIVGPAKVYCWGGSVLGPVGPHAPAVRGAPGGAGVRRPLEAWATVIQAAEGISSH